MKVTLKIAKCIAFILLFHTPVMGQEDSLSARQSDSLLAVYESGKLDHIFQTDREEKYVIKLGNEFAMGSASSIYSDQLYTVFTGLDIKVKPSLSVDNILFYERATFSAESFGLTSSVKYYYDLNKRIFEGRSANNFSADYISFGISQSVTRDQEFDIDADPPDYINSPWRYEPTLMMGYGIQRRMWAITLIDFSVYSLYNLGINEFRLLNLSLKFSFAFSNLKNHEK